MPNSHTYRFTAVIEEGRGGGAWVRVPLDVETEFGTRGHVNVTATFDGESYRGSITPMGGGTHVLGVRKDIRLAIGKEIGDPVMVTVERDTAERTVEIPAELEREFAENEGARKRYAELSDSHRREYAEWVDDAKKQETRDRRARQAIERILDS